MIFFIFVLEYAKKNLKEVAIMQSEYKNKKNKYYF